MFSALSYGSDRSASDSKPPQSSAYPVPKRSSWVPSKRDPRVTTAGRRQGDTRIHCPGHPDTFYIQAVRHHHGTVRSLSLLTTDSTGRTSVLVTRNGVVSCLSRHNVLPPQRGLRCSRCRLLQRSFSVESGSLLVRGSSPVSMRASRPFANPCGNNAYSTAFATCSETKRHGPTFSSSFEGVLRFHDLHAFAHAQIRRCMSC